MYVQRETEIKGERVCVRALRKCVCVERQRVSVCRDRERVCVEIKRECIYRVCMSVERE